MSGTPVGALFDPDYTAILCRCFMATSLLSGLLIVFCAMLSVRVDKSDRWAWGTVFVPLWLVDAVLLIWLVPMAFRPSFGRTEGAKTRRESKQQRRAREARRRGIAVTCYLVLCIVFQILIVLREDRHILWSAAAVFIPYWALEAINFINNGASALADIRDIPADDPATGVAMSGRERRMLQAAILVNAYWWWCIRVSLALLIVLKLDGQLATGWPTVFVPAYLATVRYLLLFLVAWLRLRAIDHAESRAQGKLENPAGHSMAVVFVPVFIVLSMLFCCTCCCAPCLFCLQHVPTDEMGENAARVVMVPFNRRITYAPLGSNVSTPTAVKV
ncbi:hypothetical protein THASP1DRAFT_15880 [Thamnocephalis sphaerospora]|uniref:Transmembrane protein n=1 Tax=Thamnocephalis sphaerospora TaxID=78915 RepID=A0A4P9XQE8_9FUNG|nr:hypothetical protein THASP1DRAFT_15880 [Thamnocephalis sphaerospora]|eukprot:RKP08264.1 hypothetical protein THASP1DRAFT_15880 [Thamnocephalis sphaerospora]